jgi:hypothetical protein
MTASSKEMDKVQDSPCITSCNHNELHEQNICRDNIQEPNICVINGVIEIFAVMTFINKKKVLLPHSLSNYIAVWIFGMLQVPVMPLSP